MITIAHSHPDLQEHDAALLKDCIDRGFVGWDKDLEDLLGRHIQKFVAKKQVALTPSGSIALIMALKALGVKAGDEVLIPAIDCWSVYNAIRFLDAKPVICDVRSPQDFRANYETISRHLNPKVKAVMVTHMFGVLIEEEDIQRLKKEFKVGIIEDYASSFGALYHNSSPIGKYADFVIGSFASTKQITAGVGGFIAADKKFMTEAHERPSPDLLAFNVQVSCLNQKLLQGQFERLGQILEKKKRLKKMLSKYIHIWGHDSDGLYRAITFDKADGLIQFLEEKKIKMDIRDSVQPNLARELKLDLVHARDFRAYASVPFHTDFVDTLELKGLL